MIFQYFIFSSHTRGIKINVFFYNILICSVTLRSKNKRGLAARYKGLFEVNLGKKFTFDFLHVVPWISSRELGTGKISFVFRRW